MKKIILLTSAFAVAVLTVAFTHQAAEQPDLSTTELENIEALAVDDEVVYPVACEPDGVGCALNGHFIENSTIIWSDGSRG